MPYKNGTGPNGAGPLTGGGRGFCAGYSQQGRGNWFRRGLGCFGRRFVVKDEKKFLDEEEEMLKEELAQVQKKKEALKK